MFHSIDLAYLLDGYNVLFQTPLAVADRGGVVALEASRRRLIGLLAELSHRRGPAPTAVVFDSKQARSAAPQGSQVAAGVWAVYASHLDEADPYIEELIATHRRPKTLTVVTADRKIISTARHYAATCLDPVDWYERSLERLGDFDLSWIDRGTVPTEPADSSARRGPVPPRSDFGPLDGPEVRRRASRALPEDPFAGLDEIGGG